MSNSCDAPLSNMTPEAASFLILRKIALCFVAPIPLYEHPRYFCDSILEAFTRISLCVARCNLADRLRYHKHRIMATLPEHAEVEQQKPERGLTLRLTGVPKARPS